MGEPLQAIVMDDDPPSRPYDPPSRPYDAASRPPDAARGRHEAAASLAGGQRNSAAGRSHESDYEILGHESRYCEIKQDPGEQVLAVGPTVRYDSEFVGGLGDRWMGD